MQCYPIVITETSSQSTSKPQVIFIPTAAGLMRPLGSAYEKIANGLASKGYGTTILEFTGQNEQEGSYSVSESAKGLTDFLSSYQQKLLLFGICTGALAALVAATRLTNVYSVFCWEMTPTYKYTPESYKHLEDKFGVKVDWETALNRIQPIEVIRYVNNPVFIAMGSRSKAMTKEHLSQLKESGKFITTSVHEGLGHIPGLPKGSESEFERIISNWIEYNCEKVNL